mgnify:CR=1 FL=1
MYTIYEILYPNNMRKQVEKIIDELRPMIQEDGGDVEFIGIDEKKGVVTVSLHGACCGCPLSHITLKSGIERTLQERLNKKISVVAS